MRRRKGMDRLPHGALRVPLLRLVTPEWCRGLRAGLRRSKSDHAQPPHQASYMSNPQMIKSEICYLPVMRPSGRLLFFFLPLFTWRGFPVLGLLMYGGP